MRAVEVMGRIDAQHQIQAQVPSDLPPGPVRLIVLIPEDAMTSDALTAAMDAVCVEIDTHLEPAFAGAARQVLEQSEW
jgi:hypothetical protein